MKIKSKNLTWAIKVFIGNRQFIREYNRDIKLGYILEDGTPIKCYNCGSTNLEDYDFDYLDYQLLCEYSVRCKDCGEKLGSWAYGSWQM